MAKYKSPICEGLQNGGRQNQGRQNRGRQNRGITVFSLPKTYLLKKNCLYFITIYQGVYIFCHHCNSGHSTVDQKQSITDFQELTLKFFNILLLNSFCSEFQAPFRKIRVLVAKKPFGGKQEILIEGIHIWLHADFGPCFGQKQLRSKHNECILPFNIFAIFSCNTIYTESMNRVAL